MPLMASPCLDILKIEGAVLFHPFDVAPRKALAMLPWLVSEEAWVYSCELERDHFRPVKVNYADVA